MDTAAHAVSSHYSTTSTDAMDRHEYGVQKNRKQASTGGGRAWSEEEVSTTPFRISCLDNQLTTLLGSLPSTDSSPENAIQAHCNPSQED
jgi:hypothetical protein